MPPERGAAPLSPHLLEPSGAQGQVKGRLFGREKRAALLGPGCPGDFVVHEPLPSCRWESPLIEEDRARDFHSHFGEVPPGSKAVRQTVGNQYDRRSARALPGKGESMAVLDEVKALIERLSPRAVCDDCIAERLNLSVRQHANHKTRELSGSAGFERRKAECSLCGATKLVTRLA